MLFELIVGEIVVKSRYETGAQHDDRRALPLRAEDEMILAYYYDYCYYYYYYYDVYDYYYVYVYVYVYYYYYYYYY